MNGKIKELMGQASSNACYDETYQIHLIGVEIQRFAELLVEKCAAICLITAENFAPFFSRESDGARVCHEKIKKRFGAKDNE